MNIYLVTVDNGDAEPELWAFREIDDAEAFAELRGNGASVEALAVLGHGEARQVIADEGGERVLRESTPEIRARLEELRAVLRSESVSYGELAELQSLADYIEPGDVELLEPAGVPESIEATSPLPAPPADLADAWARFTGAKDGIVEEWEARALDEWRADCAQDAGF